MTVAELAAEERVLLTGREAAKRLSISERKLYTLAKSGLIRRVKVGVKPLYRPAELERFAAEAEQ